MFRRIAAALLLSGALAGTASAGHYYYSYPSYGYGYVYGASVHVAPVYVPPVVVHTPAYVVPSPVYYRSAPVYYSRPVYRRSFWHGYRPYYGGEVEVKWKRDGYRIKVDYDD